MANVIDCQKIPHGNDPFWGVVFADPTIDEPHPIVGKRHPITSAECIHSTTSTEPPSVSRAKSPPPDEPVPEGIVLRHYHLVVASEQSGRNKPVNVWI
jgi:hypothetical protein